MRSLHIKLSTPLVLALALAVPDLSLAKQSTVDLQVQDILARPGDAVILRAKLERAGFRGRDIEGAEIEFRLDGTTLGRATTDDDGKAILPIKAPSVGDYVVKAVYAGNEDALRGEYNALLAVREASAPVMVLDIDWTISMTDNIDAAIGDGDSPPLEGGPEGVGRLDSRYDIVYVTARPRQLRKSTLAWLNRYGLPRRPAYFLDLKKFPTYNEAKYKKSIIKPLKDLFPKMSIGIGDKRTDSEAYLAAGLKAIIITDEELQGAISVPNWAAVEEAVSALEQEGAGSKRDAAEAASR